MSYSQEIEEALFEAAAAIETPEAQRAFLELVRSGDASRSRRLANLLDARAEADTFFRESVGARTMVAVAAGEDLIDGCSPEALRDEFDHAADGEPGRRIGRYRLEKRIGEGSYGVVYLAQQMEPVHRQVALKIVRLGMDTERVIARFEMERQSLAMMDHPNIARVLDAGATETGRPYFVMEWVRGLRITDYCNENRLGVRKRIDLFIEVCNAIQHAHQKGVIHRDIKPSNVLVSLNNGKAAPKVIDFGIAKATEGESRIGTAPTFNDHFVGTPAYMSPEQADQKELDIDTRVDVYSLGMLLYELLAGRPAFDSGELASVGVTEMRRILLEREPVAPSAMLASLSADELREVAGRRNTEPAKLTAAVKGDLDSVVMKAIEKNRRRRYETVNGLVMDLLRYIAHEPVIARPRSRVYLVGKFVRRNRVAVSAVAGIVISLALGLGFASAFYLRERKSRQEQVRLRKVAEAAHASELQRLAEAKGWESFAQVSILLSEGKTEEADEKLRETPLSTIQLTPQSSGVLRSLGNWNALRGRWQQASECFMLLVKANDMHRADPMVESQDMLVTGPVLVESGDLDAYDRFREWALDRFGEPSALLSIERLLHATLLTPADEDYLRQLEPLKIGLEESEFDPEKLEDGWETEFAAWRAFALSLLEYRQGDFERSRFWADRALSFQISRDYIAVGIYPVRAMARFCLGDVAGAKEDLMPARQALKVAFTPELPAAYEPMGQDQGYWWDWIISRILFREAEGLIEKGSAGSAISPEASWPE